TIGLIRDVARRAPVLPEFVESQGIPLSPQAREALGLLEVRFRVSAMMLNSIAHHNTGRELLTPEQYERELFSFAAKALEELGGRRETRELFPPELAARLARASEHAGF